MAAEIAQEAPVLMAQPSSLILIHTISIQDMFGNQIKLLPYTVNTTIQDPVTARLLMAMSKELFIHTALNSFGVWNPKSLQDVAAGEDVMDFFGGRIWSRTDVGFARGMFDELVVQYKLTVDSKDSTYI